MEKKEKKQNDDSCYKEQKSCDDLVIWNKVVNIYYKKYSCFLGNY